MDRQYSGELLEGPTHPEGTKTSGFKLAEVSFSNSERCPTFMVANIKPKFDIAYNLSRIEDIVQIAHNKKVDILVLPELVVSGYLWGNNHLQEVSAQLFESDNHRQPVKRVLDRIQSGLVNEGNGLKMVFLGNVRVDRHHSKINDTVFVISRKSDYNDVFYDKIFLTPLEKLYFNRGSDQRLIVETQWGRMGVLLCYDLCFVDLAKKYAFTDEVDIIVTSAAWRAEALRVYPLLNIRIDDYYQFIWNLMHAALAAHNQVWSIGANYVGNFEKTEGRFCGESGIWGPSGIPLAQASPEEEELLIIRNVEIRGHMRHQATEHFNYRLNFNDVYREIRDIKPKRVYLDGHK